MRSRCALPVGTCIATQVFWQLASTTSDGSLLPQNLLANSLQQRKTKKEGRQAIVVIYHNPTLYVCESHRTKALEFFECS